MVVAVTLHRLLLLNGEHIPLLGIAVQVPGKHAHIYGVAKRDEVIGVWGEVQGLDVVIVAIELVNQAILELVGLFDVFLRDGDLPDVDLGSLQVLRACRQKLSIWRKLQALKGMVTLILEEELLLVRLDTVDDHKGACYESHIAIGRVDVDRALRRDSSID